jgi:hypothetical protein
MSLGKDLNIGRTLMMTPANAANSKMRPPDSRRAAVMGLLVIAVLVVGGLLLVKVLQHMSQIQDCAMEGRTNCAPIAAPSAGNGS